MILEVDNRGAVDLANSWNVGGRTRHVKHAFLRELKEAEILKVKWLDGGEMTADIFTKNLPRATFEKHVRKVCGNDGYYKYDGTGLVRGESVRVAVDVGRGSGLTSSGTTEEVTADVGGVRFYGTDGDVKPQADGDCNEKEKVCDQKATGVVSDTLKDPG